MHRTSMWFREYKDYPIDQSLKKTKVETGRGIIGCEMHEKNGWQETIHQYRPRRKGLLRRLLEYWLGDEHSS